MTHPAPLKAFHGFPDIKSPNPHSFKSKRVQVYDSKSCEHPDTVDPSFLTVFRKGSSGEKMQREDNQVQSMRNDQEPNRLRRLRQEGQTSSGPCDSPWIESEIKIMLEEWARVEYELGDTGNMMDEKAESISRRLSNRGLRKSKNSCLDVMVKMKHLHTQLFNERPGLAPFFPPYHLILYDILGQPTFQGGYVPGDLFDCSGYHMYSWSTQPPMVMPSPVYQPWDYGMSASSGQFPGNPSPMMSSQEPLVPRSFAWNATYPLPVQHVLPASIPGDTNLQLPRSPPDDSSSPQ
ncbi:uncharacterized protein LOC110289132 [Mus caroli]|uniref:Uncharacterized protein LOC110289132 n=1 Tax=Mus caroli TaxID=10089 RepID=A0A6P5PA15_MUSCR|nr:uncharacterized protein LOC110289132 [Mus caroli]